MTDKKSLRVVKSRADIDQEFRTLAPMKTGTQVPLGKLNSLHFYAPIAKILPGCIRYNVFRQCLEVHQPFGDMIIPWDEKSTVYPYEVDDFVLNRIHSYFQEVGYVYSQAPLIRDGLLHLGDLDRYDPPQDWLQGLPPWDGVDRFARFMEDYCGVVLDEEDADDRRTRILYRRIMENWFGDSVNRLLKPGPFATAKMVPIFVGPQNLGKSAFGKHLVPHEGWFTDQIPHDLTNKDAKQALQGHMVGEFSELSQLRKTNIEGVKSKISTNVDKYRPPYGRGPITAPRRIVFYGTSNQSDILRDPTGNVRFFPILCSAHFDIEKLVADRDQIWAQALAMWRQHVKAASAWWLTDGEQGEADVIRSAFRPETTYDRLVQQFLALNTTITLKDGTEVTCRVGDPRVYFQFGSVENYVLRTETGLVTANVQNSQSTLIRDALIGADCHSRQAKVGARNSTDSGRRNQMLWAVGAPLRGWVSFGEIYDGKGKSDDGSDNVIQRS